MEGRSDESPRKDTEGCSERNECNESMTGLRSNPKGVQLSDTPLKTNIQYWSTARAGGHFVLHTCSEHRTGRVY